jgi:hypothetical protein
MRQRRYGHGRSGRTLRRRRLRWDSPRRKAGRVGERRGDFGKGWIPIQGNQLSRFDRRGTHRALVVFKKFRVLD